MVDIVKSIEVPYTLEQMEHLVTSIGQYPEFIPWIKEVQIVSQDKSKISANIYAQKWNFNFGFNMVYVLQPNHIIEIRLRSGGPFRQIAANWKFEPLLPTAKTTQKSKGTKLIFKLQLEFASPWVRWTLLPLIKRECKIVMNQFSERAEKLYEKNFRI